MSAQTASESVSHKAQSSTLSRVFAMREAGTLAALVLMVLVIAIVIPQFRQWENVVNITRNFSFVGIVALGRAQRARDQGQRLYHFGPLCRHRRHRAGQLLIECNR